MKKIVIVEVNNVMMFPPVLNLTESLLSNSHIVTMIAMGANHVPEKLKDHVNFTYIDISKNEQKNNLIKKIIARLYGASRVKTLVKEHMKDADILWTTSANTIRDLGSLVLEYTNVLQLMELTKYGYKYKNYIKYPLGKIAAKSWKVVVPEINRAYIQKVWWGLKNVPYVLPNKPYSIDYGEITEDMIKQYAKIQKENRKILLYLGGIWPDRDLETFADASELLGDDYCLYIIGKAFGDESQQTLVRLQERRNVVYLGQFSAPKHLAFVQYSHIGLLPYKPAKSFGVSELNALYCAPNKIFEYAGFGIPMLGTDVLGLRNEFEKHGIGYCCKDMTATEIVKAVKKVEGDYEGMSKRCHQFYKSINLDEIISNIIND